MQPSLNDVLEFLLHLFNGSDNRGGIGYSALNTARSALSSVITIDGHAVGSHPLVCRFMRSVFNQRPALPKYVITWDTDIMLRYLKSLGPNKRLTIQLLTHKLTMLLLLLSGQRTQTIHLFDVRNMTLTFSRVTFTIGDLLKTSRPGSHVGQVSYKGYAPDRRLCVVTALKVYLERTLDVRGAEKKLLLTLRPPIHAASRDTVRRWVRECLQAAGIDTSMFAPHSTRSASTSKAATKLPLETVLRSAGWTNGSTFAKYYKKAVGDKDFGRTILSSV